MIYIQSAPHSTVNMLQLNSTNFSKTAIIVMVVGAVVELQKTNYTQTPAQTQMKNIQVVLPQTDYVNVVRYDHKSGYEKMLPVFPF